MMIDLGKMAEATRQRDEAIVHLAKGCTIWMRYFHIAIGIVIGLALHPLVTDAVVWSGTSLVDYVFSVEPVIRR